MVIREGDTTISFCLAPSVADTEDAGSSGGLTGSLFVIPYDGLHDDDEIIPWHTHRVSCWCIHYLDQIIHSHPEMFANFCAKSASFQNSLLNTLARLLYSMKSLIIGAPS